MKKSCAAGEVALQWTLRKNVAPVYQYLKLPCRCREVELGVTVHNYLPT